MCRLFAISCDKTGDLKPMTNYLMLYYGHEKGNKDGSGFAYFRNGELISKKTKEQAFSFVINNHYEIDSNNVIAHVRQATSGGKEDIDSHPFINEKQTLAMAHNGMLSGYADLTKKLKKKKHKFTTTVDSEVLLHLFEEHELGFVEALNQNNVTGWINAIFLKQDGTIYAYSDGNLNYVELSDRVYIFQDEIFTNHKKIENGHMLIVKEGKVIEEVNLGVVKAGSLTFGDEWFQRGSNIMYGGSGGNYQPPKDEFVQDELIEEIKEILTVNFNVSYQDVTIWINKNKLYFLIDDMELDTLKKLNTVFSCFVLGKDNRKGNRNQCYASGQIKLKSFFKRLESNGINPEPLMDYGIM